MKEISRKEFINGAIATSAIALSSFLKKENQTEKIEFFAEACASLGQEEENNNKEIIQRERQSNYEDQISEIREKIEKMPEGLEKFNFRSNVEEVFDVVKGLSNKYEQIPHIKGNVSTSAYCDAIPYPDGVERCADQNIFERGWSVATYRPLFPKNSILFIEGYGWCKSQDTGGAIDGDPRCIDISLHNRDACFAWGEKVVNVVVIPPGCLSSEQIKGIKNSKLKQVTELEQSLLKESAAKTDRKDFLKNGYNLLREMIIT